jgi:hypothetical protein
VLELNAATAMAYDTRAKPLTGSVALQSSLLEPFPAAQVWGMPAELTADIASSINDEMSPPQLPMLAETTFIALSRAQ